MARTAVTHVGNGEIAATPKARRRRRQGRQVMGSRSGAATGMGSTINAPTGPARGRAVHISGTPNLQNLTKEQASEFGHLCTLAGLEWAVR